MEGSDDGVLGFGPNKNRGCRIERTGLTSDTNGDPIPALCTRLSVPDYGHPVPVYVRDMDAVLV